MLTRSALLQVESALRYATLILVMLLVTGSVSNVYAWDIERPSGHVSFASERMDTSESDGSASVGLGVQVTDYFENAPLIDGYDGLALLVAASANSREAIDYTHEVGSRDDVVPWTIREHELQGLYVASAIGDDAGAWINIHNTFPEGGEVRFYSGPLSDYQRVWVCTNGFLSFGNSCSTMRCPGGFPDQSEPNAVIAPLWTDLVVDNDASITYGWFYQWGYWFVVSWNNVLIKGTSVRLTFRILMKWATVTNHYEQSQVYIDYVSIPSITVTYAWGIENPTGAKGIGGRTTGNLGSLDRHAHGFRQYSSSAFIKRLTLSFVEEDNYAFVDIVDAPTDAGWMRGMNLQLNENPPPTEDDAQRFLTVLLGKGVTLAPKVAAMSGIILLVLIGDEAVTVLGVCEIFSTMALFARMMMSNVRYDPTSLRDGNVPEDQGASISVPTLLSPNEEYYPVDALLGIKVFWKFSDPNTVSHSLSVYAAVTYVEYTLSSEKIEKTLLTRQPVNLNVCSDAWNDFSSARTITRGTYIAWLGDVESSLGTDDWIDFYKICSYINVSITMTPPDNAPGFDLYLYDASWNELAHSTRPGHETEHISYTAFAPADFYIKVNVTSDGGHGLYVLSVDGMMLETKGAVKTSCQPYGPIYGCSIPNVPANLVKLMFFFDNPKLSRDRGGLPSPFPHISWPDGKINVKDTYFMGQNYGRVEGGPSWNYMSDLNNDGKCDVKDYYFMGMSFGVIGEYLPDSTPIDIFIDGQALKPDANGYVHVSHVPSYLEVYSNGHAIGVMAILFLAT